jgi:hypothetical protein
MVPPVNNAAVPPSCLKNFLLVGDDITIVLIHMMVTKVKTLATGLQKKCAQKMDAFLEIKAYD